MYEILTLRRPFQGVQREALFRAILESDVPDPRELNPLVSRDAWTVLEKALSKDPGQRYPTAEEMGEDLRRLAAGKSVSARPLSSAQRLWRRVRKKPLAAVVALLVLALLFGLGYGIARWPEIQRGRQALRVSTQREELTQAFAHLTEGNQEAARALFDRIIREDPTSTLALAGLVLSDAQSHPERALSACNRYAATTADPAALEFLRGDLLARLTREEAVDVSLAKGATAAYIKGSVQMLHVRTGRMLHEAAARAFREAIMLSTEDYPFFYFSLAEAVGGLSDKEEARKIADVILSKWPDSPHARYYAGRALRESDPNAAAEHFEVASQSPELAASAHQSAARLHLTKTKDLELATKHLDALAASSIPSYDFLALRILQAELAKDEAAALQRARVLTDAYPHMGKAWLVLAQQEIQRGQRAEALTSVRRALKEDPYFWRGMAFLGWLLAGEGDIAQATHWLERAIQEEPRALRPKCDMGLAYMAIRQETSAIPLLEECLASDDGAIRKSAAKSLAQAYLTRGRAEDALVALRSAHPNPSDRDQRLVRRAVLRQETPLAERRSESSDDDLLQAMDLEAVGMFEEAAQAWQRVREPLTPSPMDHPRVRAAICLLRAANGKRGAARVEIVREAVSHLTPMVDAYSKTVVGFRVLAHGLVLEPGVGTWFHGAPEPRDEAQELFMPIVDALRSTDLRRPITIGWHF
jgi:tetratricopeptide (TPR) repeat protein